ncbi:MAG: hypothetical protein JNK71_13670 [Methyloversatilis sp.]|nr:hypothetical protein [Methyloversatilis sp.]
MLAKNFILMFANKKTNDVLWVHIRVQPSGSLHSNAVPCQNVKFFAASKNNSFYSACLKTKYHHKITQNQFFTTIGDLPQITSYLSKSWSVPYWPSLAAEKIPGFGDPALIFEISEMNELLRGDV